jgi:hypothetical protein
VVVVDLGIGSEKRRSRRDPFLGRNRQGLGNVPPIEIDGGTETTSFCCIPIWFEYRFVVFYSTLQ